ncbi:MAG: hypothetical protein P8X73_00785 [Ignavibacteriaceae bacterium]
MKINRNILLFLFVPYPIFHHFTCLIQSQEKFKEETTLTILFAFNLTIDEYNSKSLVELKNYKIIRLNND